MAGNDIAIRYQVSRLSTFMPLREGVEEDYARALKDYYSKDVEAAIDYFMSTWTGKGLPRPAQVLERVRAVVVERQSKVNNADDEQYRDPDIGRAFLAAFRRVPMLKDKAVRAHYTKEVSRLFTEADDKNRKDMVIEFYNNLTFEIDMAIGKQGGHGGKLPKAIVTADTKNLPAQEKAKEPVSIGDISW